MSTRSLAWPAALALCLTTTAALPARTIELTDEDCDRMAATAEEAPLLGWVGFEAAGPSFVPVYVELIASRAFLIRYPLDAIPKGQRITQAEWVIPVAYCPGEQKMYVHRLIGDWGAGVCHKYRMVRPQKVEWNTAGAKGPSSDRAVKPTAVPRMTDVGDVVINVTQDVELWYSGAAKNQGWLLTVEDKAFVRLASPMWTSRGTWKLRITYEPE